MAGGFSSGFSSGFDVLTGIPVLEDAYWPAWYFSAWWPVDYFQEEPTGGAVLIAQERSMSRFVFGRIFGRVN